MATQACIAKQPKGLSAFEKYLTLWVVLCIGAGILLGRIAPQVARFLDGLTLNVLMLAWPSPTVLAWQAGG